MDPNIFPASPHTHILVEHSECIRTNIPGDDAHSIQCRTSGFDFLLSSVIVGQPGRTVVLRNDNNTYEKVSPNNIASATYGGWWSAMRREWRDVDECAKTKCDCGCVNSARSINQNQSPGICCSGGCDEFRRFVMVFGGARKKKEDIENYWWMDKVKCGWEPPVAVGFSKSIEKCV